MMEVDPGEPGENPFEQFQQGGFVRVQRRGLDATAYVLGYMLEALRLEIRAASRRRDPALSDVRRFEEASYYEGSADSAASLAHAAYDRTDVPDTEGR